MFLSPLRWSSYPQVSRPRPWLTHLPCLTDTGQASGSHGCLYFCANASLISAPVAPTTRMSQFCTSHAYHTYHAYPAYTHHTNHSYPVYTCHTYHTYLTSHIPHISHITNITHFLFICLTHFSPITHTPGCCSTGQGGCCCTGARRVVGVVSPSRAGAA